MDFLCVCVCVCLELCLLLVELYPTSKHKLTQSHESSLHEHHCMQCSLLDLAHTVSEREKLSFLHTWTVPKIEESCPKPFRVFNWKDEIFFIGQRWRPAGGGGGGVECKLETARSLSPLKNNNRVLCDLNNNNVHLSCAYQHPERSHDTY